MDWYFGSGIDDLVVPKYQELSDRLPSSPDSWSKWGIREPESFKDIGFVCLHPVVALHGH
jgi:hypothetical protein